MFRIKNFDWVFICFEANGKSGLVYKVNFSYSTLRCEILQPHLTEWCARHSCKQEWRTTFLMFLYNRTSFCTISLKIGYWLRLGYNFRCQRSTRCSIIWSEPVLKQIRKQMNSSLRSCSGRKRQIVIIFFILQPHLKTLVDYTKYVHKYFVD